MDVLYRSWLSAMAAMFLSSWAPDLVPGAALAEVFVTPRKFCWEGLFIPTERIWVELFLVRCLDALFCVVDGDQSTLVYPATLAAKLN